MDLVTTQNFQVTVMSLRGILRLLEPKKGSRSRRGNIYEKVQEVIYMRNFVPRSKNVKFGLNRCNNKSWKIFWTENVIKLT